MSARDDYPAIWNGLLRSNRVYADEVHQMKKVLDEVDQLRAALSCSTEAWKWVADHYPAALESLPSHLFHGLQRAARSLKDSSIWPPTDGGRK